MLLGSGRVGGVAAVADRHTQESVPLGVVWFIITSIIIITPIRSQHSHSVIALREQQQGSIKIVCAYIIVSFSHIFRRTERFHTIGVSVEQ